MKNIGVKSESTLRAFKKIFDSTLDEAIPLFTKEQFANRKSMDELLNWKCKICGKQFKSAWRFGMIVRKCPCQLNAGTSKKEQELIEFCQQFYPNLIIKDRQLIKPYELDIVIPELHLVLEFNR